MSYAILQHINAMAQIKQAQFGSVDIDFVLGIGGYDLDRCVRSFAIAYYS